MPEIQLKGVTKRYPDRTEAVKANDDPVNLFVVMSRPRPLARHETLTSTREQQRGLATKPASCLPPPHRDDAKGRGGHFLGGSDWANSTASCTHRRS